MKTYKAAVIGCGRPSLGVDANMQGFAIAYYHGKAYRNHPRIQLAAAADISEENAAAFAEHFGVPSTYQDYQAMLAKEKPDIVSICTWPTLHKEMVCHAAAAGVRMIWCEKPMAVGIDEMDTMVRVCREQGVRLYVNHQRRYERHYQATRQMIDDGVLGRIERLEGWVGAGWDLMSWGTHWVDMHRFFMHDADVQWVVASAPHSGQIRYGHPVEKHMLLQFQFVNETISLIHLGNHLDSMGVRVIGSDGSVTLKTGGDKFVIQHRSRPAELHAKYVEGVQPVNGMEAALSDIIESFEHNKPAEIDGINGLRSSEIVMAAYQSSVKRDKLEVGQLDRTFHLLKDYI